MPEQEKVFIPIKRADGKPIGFATREAIIKHGLIAAEETEKPLRRPAETLEVTRNDGKVERKKFLENMANQGENAFDQTTLDGDQNFFIASVLKKIADDKDNIILSKLPDLSDEEIGAFLAVGLTFGDEAKDRIEQVKLKFAPKPTISEPNLTTEPTLPSLTNEPTL